MTDGGLNVGQHGAVREVLAIFTATHLAIEVAIEGANSPSTCADDSFLVKHMSSLFWYRDVLGVHSIKMLQSAFS